MGPECFEEDVLDIPVGELTILWLELNGGQQI